VAALIGGNVVTGDDISRVNDVYEDVLLPEAAPTGVGDEGITDLGFDNEHFTNIISVPRQATTGADSGYLSFFSYLPSSYFTPPYPTFVLLVTPGVQLESGTGAKESWGLVGD